LRGERIVREVKDVEGCEVHDIASELSVGPQHTYAVMPIIARIPRTT